jgi:copper homeostasis protein
MCMDAHLLLQNGADGIAFGALHADRSIDANTTRKLVEIAHAYKKEFVFHRAIDCVDKPIESIQTLIDLKVDRVLTSGFQSTAVEGMEMLTYLQRTFGKDIEFLVGGKVNATNAVQIIQQTQIHQLHASCKTWVVDPSTHNETVSYAYGGYDSHYECVDLNLVNELVDASKQDAS